MIMSGQSQFLNSVEFLTLNRWSRAAGRSTSSCSGRRAMCGRRSYRSGKTEPAAPEIVPPTTLFLPQIDIPPHHDRDVLDVAAVREDVVQPAFREQPYPTQPVHPADPRVHPGVVVAAQAVGHVVPLEP